MRKLQYIKSEDLTKYNLLVRTQESSSEVIYDNVNEALKYYNFLLLLQKNLYKNSENYRVVNDDKYHEFKVISISNKNSNKTMMECVIMKIEETKLEIEEQ